MRNTILIAALIILAAGAQAQQSESKYDEALASSLGADDYGMKMYVLVILKTGPTAIEDAEERKKLFQGHMDNMGRLSEEGKLIVAGPLEKNDKTYRGIFIMNVPTIAEAEALVATDPAVSSGMLATELYGWYGSAALPVYMDTHEKIQKKQF